MNQKAILPRASDSAEPLYITISRRIREQLDAGDYPAGTFLPPERELSSHIKVSLRTLRQALSVLQKEGRITRRQGHGTIVNAAPSTRNSAPPIVAVAFEKIIPDYRGVIFCALCSELNRCGLSVLVVSMPISKTFPQPKAAPGPSLDGVLKDLIAQGRVHGIIGFPRAFLSCPDLPAKSGLPVLMMETRNHIPHADSVGINNTPGVLAAVSELIRQGHKHIAFVGALGRPSDRLPYKLLDDSSERFAAYRQALHQGGIDFQQSWYYENGFEDADADAMVQGWLAKGNLPTAVMVFDDTLAGHLLRSLRRAGLSVPGDVSVVGFGNLTVEAQTGQLATVAVDFQEMARLAAQRMRERINSGGMTEVFLRASCRFKPGASIAPPRQTGA